MYTLLLQDSGNNSLHAPASPLQFKNEISFNKISFAYEKDNRDYLIENIDITMLKGQKIAIIGPTGSGKSTFLDLLLGMIEPDSGEITMDEEVLSKKNLHSYRRNFAYVPQKIFFVEDTLQENIVFGSNQELDIDKLDRAILNASLQELIDDLPNGLQTNISDSNQMVSGGQKQCIGIARALYRGGDILILDEATSGMDQALEKKIYASLIVNLKLLFPSHINLACLINLTKFLYLTMAASKQ